MSITKVNDPFTEWERVRMISKNPRLFEDNLREENRKREEIKLAAKKEKNSRRSKNKLLPVSKRAIVPKKTMIRNTKVVHLSNNGINSTATRNSSQQTDYLLSSNPLLSRDLFQTSSVGIQCNLDELKTVNELTKQVVPREQTNINEEHKLASNASIEKLTSNQLLHPQSKNPSQKNDTRYEKIETFHPSNTNRWISIKPKSNKSVASTAFGHDDDSTPFIGMNSSNIHPVCQIADKTTPQQDEINSEFQATSNQKLLPRKKEASSKIHREIKQLFGSKPYQRPSIDENIRTRSIRNQSKLEPKKAVEKKEKWMGKELKIILYDIKNDLKLLTKK